MTKKEKVLVAFSGGLDTSYCVVYFKNLGYEVITATVETGGFGPDKLQEITEHAQKIGATAHHNIVAQDDLYDTWVAPLIQANYLRGGTYPPCVGPEREVIVRHIVSLAKDLGIKTIVHGSTGAGGDQIRFEVALRALMPEATVLAPIRDLGLTRADEYTFLQQQGVSLPTGSKDYSINVSLIGNTIGGKETLDSKDPLPDSAYPTIPSLDSCAQDPWVFTVDFKKGLPTHVDAVPMNGAKILELLNARGAEHGFGRGTHIGLAIIGVKARIGFEAPGYKILVHAHKELEKLVLTSQQSFWKDHLGNLYGNLVHESYYYEPLARDIEALLTSASRFVEGQVRIKIHKGNIEILGMTSPYSLLNSAHGTYGETMKGWDGRDAKAIANFYARESVIAHLTQNHIKVEP